MKKEIRHINLNEIKDPSFLKELSYKELDALSFDISNYLVDITSKTGGHLSSNLGVVDATIALCRVFDFSKDKIIFDVGHQSYTYKLLTGRDLHTLRQKDGVSGFQKRDESPYDHYECGHSSTSIGAALGMAIARDHKKEKYDMISFIGDSSFTNGLALEAFNDSKNHEKNKVIIILNDNDMSISHAVGGISHVLRNISISTFYRKSRNLFKKMMSLTRVGRGIYRSTRRFKTWVKKVLIRTSFLDSMGMAIVGPVDGHDIKEMEKCFKKAKNNDKSVLIVLKTIKGKGYKYAEEDKEGRWHGVPPFDKETGEFVKNDNYSWSKYYASLIDRRMEEDQDTFTIVPGTGYGSGLSPLFKKYPSRMLDVGISEEHAFILASGLAISGMHPNIVIYSTFLQRSYDELSHDLARMNLSSTILIDRAGLVGSDGETHQGLYDVGFLASIPNITIAMASNTHEADELYKESYSSSHGPFAIRFPKTNRVDSLETYPVPYGSWRKILEGNNIAVISVGPIINDLEKELLKYENPIALYNAIYILPYDKEMLKEIISHNYSKIIIYDPYSIRNGLSSIVSAYLATNGFKGELVIKCIPYEYIKQATIEEQLKECDLTVEDVLKNGR